MNKFMFRFPGGAEEASLMLGNYENGRTALILTCAARGYINYHLTVDMPMVLLDEDEIIIKEYMDEAVIFHFLVANFIITDTGKSLPTSLGKVKVCQLSDWKLWGTTPPPPPKQFDLSGFEEDPEMDNLPIEQRNEMVAGKEIYDINGYNILATSPEHAEEIYAMVRKYEGENNILEF